MSMQDVEMSLIDVGYTWELSETKDKSSSEIFKLPSDVCELRQLVLDHVEKGSIDLSSLFNFDLLRTKMADDLAEEWREKPLSALLHSSFSQQKTTYFLALQALTKRAVVSDAYAQLVLLDLVVRGKITCSLYRSVQLFAIVKTQLAASSAASIDSDEKIKSSGSLHSESVKKYADLIFLLLTTQQAEFITRIKELDDSFLLLKAYQGHASLLDFINSQNLKKNKLTEDDLFELCRLFITLSKFKPVLEVLDSTHIDNFSVINLMRIARLGEERNHKDARNMTGLAAGRVLVSRRSNLQQLKQARDLVIASLNLTDETSLLSPEKTSCFGRIFEYALRTCSLVWR